MRKLTIALVTLALCLCMCFAFDLILALTVAFRDIVSYPPPPRPKTEPEPVPTLVRTPVREEDLSTVESLRRTVIPVRDLYAISQRLKGLDAAPSPVNDVPPSYEVGQRERFWVSDEDVSDTYFTIDAVLRYATPHVYMWVEDGLHLDQRGVEASALEFEERIYPTNRRYFGSEPSPGVDNDAHIHVLNAHLPSVGGYYSSNDEHPTAINPFSNQKEIIYINAGGARPDTEAYNGTLAHEFQHMIHWNVDPNEDTWVNEGCAQTAETLNGYRLWPVFFLDMPDTQLTAWADEMAEASVHYNASYLFIYYFAERFGADLMRELTATEADGMPGIDEVLAAHGLDITSEDVFRDWVLANYLNDPSLGDGRFGYQGIGLPASVAVDYRHLQYPATRSSTVHQYAADYVELERGGGDLVIDFNGSTRVKLVDNEPHSGERQWWSNRGDVSDMTLTREFDLVGLEEATLEFWVWYDIEEDYDYAYVEVSADDGRTWDILPGRYTTDANPYGNNFGRGYTGISGGGAEPAWVQEQLDLTPYVGQDVMIRFEYVTDDSYNDTGLCLDDVAIPELGYSYDAETVGGWEAQGFVLSNNLLPQEWIVQVIEFGARTTIEEVDLGETQQGQLIVESLGGEVDKAVLVIAALAPATREVASYEYRVYLRE